MNKIKKQHWHFNKKTNFDYVECSKENCKEIKIEEHSLPEKLLKCRICDKPFIRTSPYSWKGSCKHMKLGLMCM